MEDIKEVKSVDLISFTLIASSTAAILAFIYAVIILFISGIIVVFIPQVAGFKDVISGLGVASLIILPIGAYFLVMAVSFFTALMYNGLSQRISGFKVGLDGNEIIQIPKKIFALIISSIEGIWAFILGLFLAAAVLPFTDIINSLIQYFINTIPDATNIVGALPLGIGADGLSLAALLLIGFPVIVFLFGFVSSILFAVFYNQIASKIIKMELEFEKITGTLHELKSLPVVATAAPVSGAVFGAFGVIMGFITLLSLALTGNPSVTNLTNDILIIVMNGLFYFIGYFLIFALIAVIYNFMAPRIGGIKLNLE